MSEKLIECVPNFSEGKDKGIIKQITDEIEKIDLKLNQNLARNPIPG